ncbi:MAG TPA: flagellar motor switch protein FliG [Candidatus Binatia bacterium]|nr:flagellar motor switch protein FliG [Candidatus Binatia bacterium]
MRSAALDTIPGPRRAALVVMALGAETAAEVLRHLAPEEIEALTVELSRPHELEPEIVEGVLEEATRQVQAHPELLGGGLDYVRDVLERALGREQTRDLVDRLQQSFQPQPFGALRKVNVKHLADFLGREDAQTIAVVLGHLDAETGAQLLTHLPEALRAEVVRRLATLESVPPEVIKHIDHILERRAAGFAARSLGPAAGPRTAADILNRVDRSVEKQVFAALESADGKLADNIRRLMFTFDDLVRLDDRSVQRLLRDVDQKDLALALKAASPEVTQQIFRNLSERAQAMLRQEIEFLGPVRLRDVERAQSQIVRLVRELEEAGEVVVASKSEGEVLV